MKKLILVIVASLTVLVGCGQETMPTEELMKNYEEFITDANAEIQMVKILLPIWEQSRPDSKETQLSLFYDSREKLTKIGFNKETKEFYKSLVNFNEVRLEIFNQTFDNVTGSFNQDKMTELQHEFKIAIQQVELEYNKLK